MPLLELAGVDADVRQVAVLVVDDLERQAAERLVRVVRRVELHVLVVRVVPSTGGLVRRGRAGNR